MNFNKLAYSILVVIAAILPCAGQAQLSKLSVALNPISIAHTGRSYGVSFQYDLTDKFRIYIGGKFHQNFLVDPVFNSQKFRYRFYANSLGQHFGYSLGANYFINWKYSVLKPYVYYDITYYKMGTRSLIFTPTDSTDIYGGKLQKVTPLKYYNLNTLEQNIGLGFECPLTKWLSINMRGGVGANFISNLPSKDYASGTHTELGAQFQVGMQVNF